MTRYLDRQVTYLEGTLAKLPVSRGKELCIAALSRGRYTRFDLEVIYDFCIGKCDEQAVVDQLESTDHLWGVKGMRMS